VLFTKASPAEMPAENRFPLPQRSGKFLPTEKSTLSIFVPIFAGPMENPLPLTTTASAGCAPFNPAPPPPMRKFFSAFKTQKHFIKASYPQTPSASKPPTSKLSASASPTRSPTFPPSHPSPPTFPFTKLPWKSMGIAGLNPTHGSATAPTDSSIGKLTTASL